MNQRLYRSRDDRMIAGVAGGVADHLGVDPSIVRILWVLLAIFSGGIFFLLYLVMMVVVPEEPVDWVVEEGGAAAPAETPAEGAGGAPVGGAPVGGTGPTATATEAARAARRAERAAPRRERHDGTGSVILGLILILVGGFFLLRMYIPWLDAGRFWPLLLVIIGLVLILGAIRPGSGTSQR